MNDTDSINPYELPQEAQTLGSADLPENRPHAVRSIRIAVITLLLAAIVNVECLYSPRFNLLHGITLGSPMQGGKPLAMFVEMGWVSAAAIAIGLFGIRLLDAIADLIRRRFGHSFSRTLWLESMYSSMWPLVPAAVVGAFIWLTWLGTFFGLPGYDTPAVCAVFGTIGHLLAASIYLSAFYGWYRLRQAKRTSEQLQTQTRSEE